MPKGERVLAQSKRTAPPRQFQANFKFFETKFSMFSIGIFQISIPLRNSISIGIYILRRKFSKLVSKIFWSSFKWYKPSWTLRGEFHQGGVLFSQRKSIWNRGRKFQILKMLLEILFIYLWLYAKRLWKEFPKRFAKTKHVVQMWSKMLKERKQSMHILWKYKLV
jgi:hypothetical protein